jgi:hypothetical protein
MAVMMGSLYAALVKAGAGEDEAKRAAEEVANFELRLNTLESKIDRLDSKFDSRFQAVEARFDAKFTLLSWMIGTNMAITLGVLALILRASGAR